MRGCRTRESIETRLSSLPSGLKDTYDEIYSRIRDSDDLGQKLVGRAIMWVMRAVKPFTSNEILSAIRIDATKESLQLSSEINEEDLLFFCQHLLVIDHKRIWRVSHLSVTEYFEKHYWTPQEAHLHVGNACLLALLDMPEPNGEVAFDGKPKDLTEVPAGTMSRALELHVDFQRYVHFHWPLHVQALNNSQRSQLSSMTVLLVKFIGSFTVGSDWYRFWLQRIARTPDDQHPRSRPSRGHARTFLSSHTPPIVAVCLLGIYTALGEWWDNLEDCFEQVNSENHELVQVAALGNSFPICDRLLDAGAPVDFNTHGRSLQHALLNKNVEIARLLHTKNRWQIDQLVQHVSYRDMLHSAFNVSDRKIVQIFCSDDRFDVNMPLNHTGDYGDLLSLVAKRNEPNVLEVLIDHGAHVNLALESGAYGSALAIAAHRGHLSTVEYLLQRGADANLPLKCGLFGSALAAATGSSHDSHQRLDTIRCLVDRGADVNLPLTCGYYGSALTAAVWRGNLDVITYLVDCGADVNLPLSCGEYESALAAAVRRGNLRIVKCLLQRGADVNLQLSRGEYGSALAAAARRGNLRIVECLVQRGADIDLPLSRGYGSALAAAIAASPMSLNQDTIKYLIDNHANVDLRLEYGEHGSALSVAAALSLGGLDMTKYLVSCGADVNLPLKCGRYGSALVTACSHIHNFDIVKYLVEMGAEVNPSLNCGEFGSPLAAAAYFGNRECVEFLIQQGALVDSQEKAGRFSNAIEAAGAELSMEELERNNDPEQDKQDTFESRVTKKVGILELLRSLVDVQPAPETSPATV